jgi:hypothetical protein
MTEPIPGRSFLCRTVLCACAALALAAAPAAAVVFETEPDGLGDPPNALPLAAGGGVVVHGDLAPGDADAYEVSVAAGEEITASVIEFDEGEFVDPVLGVFSGASLLATDDDDGSGFLPSLRFTSPQTGTLRIVVSGAADADFDGAHGESVAYRLVVTKPPPDAQESDEVGNDTTPESLGAGGAAGDFEVREDLRVRGRSEPLTVYVHGTRGAPAAA